MTLMRLRLLKHGCSEFSNHGRPVVGTPRRYQVGDGQLAPTVKFKDRQGQSNRAVRRPHREKVESPIAVTRLISVSSRARRFRRRPLRSPRSGLWRLGQYSRRLRAPLRESLHRPTSRALIEVDVGGADAELAYWRDNRAGLRTIKCHACLLNQGIADPIEPAVAKCSFPYQRLYQQGTASMQNTQR